MNKCAVIVDPIASGRFLPDEFAARGLDCIAILSQPIPEKFQSHFEVQKFRRVIWYDGNLTALEAALQDWQPTCVTVGLETGLDLMDRLSMRLGLPGNDCNTTACRRDKYQMHERLRTQGVRSIQQCRVDGGAGMREALSAFNHWPVIIKPTISAGSDNVHICRTMPEAVHAVRDIVGVKNALGETNQYALVQEYLQGQEWVVDTVSCNGRHVVTNICRYRKVVTADSRSIFQHTEYLSPATGDFQQLIDYALQVNDALGIRYGAAHHEVMMTANGPTLIEVNARMHGIDATEMLRMHCCPISQIDLTVDSLIDPQAFSAKADQPLVYRTHLIAHFLTAQCDGTVTAVADEATVNAIPSVRRSYLPKVDQLIQKTVSLINVPGFIWLANEDMEALHRDQKLLLTMEAEGKLYQVSPT
jgi:hypothetical protein